MGSDGTAIGRRFAVAFSVLLGAAVPAAAQDRMDALVERLERQEREIQALREEVKELRDQGAGSAQAPRVPPRGRRVPADRLREPAHPARHRGAGQSGRHRRRRRQRDRRATSSTTTPPQAASASPASATFDQRPDLGSTLEIAFSPNNSFDVSQDNETGRRLHLGAARRSLGARRSLRPRDVRPRIGGGRQHRGVRPDARERPDHDFGRLVRRRRARVHRRRRSVGRQHLRRLLQLRRRPAEPRPLRLADVRSGAALASRRAPTSATTPRSPSAATTTTGPASICAAFTGLGGVVDLATQRRRRGLPRSRARGRSCTTTAASA